jgi:hypothetical protein
MGAAGSCLLNRYTRDLGPRFGRACEADL